MVYNPSVLEKKQKKITHKPRRYTYKLIIKLIYRLFWTSFVPEISFFFFFLIFRDLDRQDISSIFGIQIMFP